MKKYFTLLLAICILSGSSFSQKGQYNQESLPRLSVADSIGLSNLPELKLPEFLKGPNAPLLPTIVDNSANIYWRPVFAQVALECGQASGVGLGFTYAINRLRDLPSDVPENQYPTHFVWNFGQNGDGYYGVSYFHSFEIIRAEGTPTVETYGGMSAGGSARWMTGYDNYYEAMHNRLTEIYKIDVSTEEGIHTAKNWIHNNLEGADVGGVANFYTNAPYGMQTLPPGTPEAGKYVVTSWSYANHGLTISGYHDSICWDYNNNGQYTNNVDINGDGVVNVRDWEIGGFRFANTYSGGPSFGNNGFSYMTYKSCADPYGSGGIWDNAIHVIYAKENHEPLLTAKIKMTYTCRNRIRVRIGASTNVNADSPEYVLTFPLFNYQGGCNYMQGGTSTGDQTIEFGLDITPLLNMLGTGLPARYFLLVDEADPEGWGWGTVDNFSIIDYTEGVLEMPSAQTNVSIVENGTTTLWVNHTVDFDPISVDTDDLPPASLYEPYNCQLYAAGGSPSYYWDFDLNYTETNYTETFPMVTAQQLNPGGSYTTKQLDFSFPFAENEYEQVRIYTDGYIMFENEFTWPYQVYDFFNFTKNKLISPFQADLTLNSIDNDGVWYEGDESSATFRWKASVTGQQNTTELNFAVRLFSNGDIRFYYGNTNEFENLEWISGISAGNNKYYQFTQVSNKPEIPANFVCDLKSFGRPEGFSITPAGIFNGIPEQILDNFEIKFRVMDESNLTDSKVLYLSTDGSDYLVIDDYEVQAGDDNIIEYGETVYLTVSVKSLGQNPINGVNMVIASEDEFITLTDGDENLGNFAAGETKTFTNAFTFDVSYEVPDDHTIDFATLITDDSGGEWSGHIYLDAYSPELHFSGVEVDDGGNGILDPGESADLIVTILNSGGATATNVEAVLSSTDPFVTINTNTGNLEEIDGYSSGNVTYNIYVSEEIPVGYNIGFELEITADNDITGYGSFTVIAGQLPVLIIDMDDNLSSGPEIQAAMENIGLSVDYVTFFPTDISLYSSVFLCLGIYGDNYVLSSSEGTFLAEYLENGGKLFMEGGDTWAYDTQTQVHSMFNINGEGDGSNDLGTVLGQSGTFTEGMSFYYGGENAWIDHISPIGDAFLIFENSSPNYGVAVAFDEGSYKTIGTSFEFGGLSDGASPSTKVELMTEILDFFGISSVDLIANFVSDITEVCEEDTVNFYDASSGNIVSWFWQFQGGDPATSNEQNPTVTYHDAGEYDVTLTVSDGSNINSMFLSNYITVNPNPVIPDMPQGDELVCTNNTYYTAYTTNANPNNQTFNWEIEPSEAGSISGSGITGTVAWTLNWEGAAIIRVKGSNTFCGESEFSEGFEVTCQVCTGIEGLLNNTTINIYPNPSDGKFYLKTNHDLPSTKITVVNVINEHVWETNTDIIKNQTLLIDLQGRQKGLYLLKAENQDFIYTEKLLLK
ncbi:MAG: PKD domain-containing protein [Bacteroidales bacterium]|nr:PKD domain-containing protein [Bacteroidales bacterium]